MFWKRLHSAHMFSAGKHRGENKTNDRYNRPNFSAELNDIIIFIVNIRPQLQSFGFERKKGSLLHDLHIWRFCDIEFVHRMQNRQHARVRARHTSEKARLDKEVNRKWNFRSLHNQIRTGVYWPNSKTWRKKTHWKHENGKVYENRMCFECFSTTSEMRRIHFRFASVKNFSLSKRQKKILWKICFLNINCRKRASGAFNCDILDSCHSCNRIIWFWLLFCLYHMCICRYCNISPVLSPESWSITRRFAIANVSFSELAKR